MRAEISWAPMKATSTTTSTKVTLRKSEKTSPTAARTKFKASSCTPRPREPRSPRSSTSTISNRTAELQTALFRALSFTRKFIGPRSLLDRGPGSVSSHPSDQRQLSIRVAPALAILAMTFVAGCGDGSSSTSNQVVPTTRSRTDVGSEARKIGSEPTDTGRARRHKRRDTNSRQRETPSSSPNGSSSTRPESGSRQGENGDTSEHLKRQNNEPGTAASSN